ncbi:MAG: dicarboxylate--CoA ligase PimA [Alphaproteobacteria bacterium]|nr:dicarboxylate--CoA ligase PimA [Alphaproteobacteria bacterium]
MIERPFSWERSYPAGVRWDAPIAASTVPALFDAAVRAYGPRTAIDFRGRAILYAELGRAVDRLAAALLRAGIGPGGALAIHLPNTPDLPIAFFAGARTGARVVMLSPLDGERVLAHKLRDSGARMMIASDRAELLPAALRLLDAGHLDRVIVAEEAAWGDAAEPGAEIDFDTRLQRLADFTEGTVPPAAWPAVVPSDLALLQYTGGTTGLPKGAMLTHANLTVAVGMYNEWLNGQGATHPGKERVLCVLPLFHIYGLTTILLRHLDNGNVILLRTRFDVERTLHDIEVGRATCFQGVPTMWIALANHPGIERRDLSSLRYCSSGGAPLPLEVAQRFERLTGRRLGGGWGMTETSPAGTHRPVAGPAKPGSIGLPLPGIEIAIVALDDPRRILPPDTVGEIAIKGRNVTAGYWNRPEESAAAFAGVYFLTGDVGRMDADGYVFLVDRKKDMIISGGFNVYPQMIEQAIYEHPDVTEALVVGVADPYRGEAAKAFVTLRVGAPPLTLDALRQFLRDKLGRHELPAALEIREALPRTAVGKLSRLALREEERRRQPAV